MRLLTRDRLPFLSEPQLGEPVEHECQNALFLASYCSDPFNETPFFFLSLSFFFFSCFPFFSGAGHIKLFSFNMKCINNLAQVMCAKLHMLTVEVASCRFCMSIWREKPMKMAFSDISVLAWTIHEESFQYQRSTVHIFTPTVYSTDTVHSR